MVGCTTIQCAKAALEPFADTWTLHGKPRPPPRHPPRSARDRQHMLFEDRQRALVKAKKSPVGISPTGPFVCHGQKRSRRSSSEQPGYQRLTRVIFTELLLP
jgi:hypothetical protein